MTTLDPKNIQFFLSFFTILLIGSIMILVGDYFFGIGTNDPHFYLFAFSTLFIVSFIVPLATTLKIQSPTTIGSNQKLKEEKKLEQIPETKKKISKETYYCRYCGKKNQLDAVFCESCGKKIN